MSTETKEERPKPGSDAAVALGCTCPRMDNAYGAGYMGMEGIYCYTEGCKVHAIELAVLNRKDTERIE